MADAKLHDDMVLRNEPTVLKSALNQGLEISYSCLHLDIFNHIQTWV